MDQTDLGARDLNEINYTTFLFPPINPCDWFQQPQSWISD